MNCAYRHRMGGAEWFPHLSPAAHSLEGEPSARPPMPIWFADNYQVALPIDPAAPLCCLACRHPSQSRRRFRSRSAKDAARASSPASRSTTTAASTACARIATRRSLPISNGSARPSSNRPATISAHPALLAPVDAAADVQAAPAARANTRATAFDRYQVRSVNGLNATSQRWPSGSAKYPEYPPHDVSRGGFTNFAPDDTARFTT